MSDQTGQLELREFLDREQVVALVHRYVTTLDEPSVFDDDWARSLFTEDVRLEHEIAVLEGIEEVAAAHRMVMGRWGRTLHFSTNHCVELDGEHAHLTARLIAIHVHPGEDPPDSLIAANILEADALFTDRGGASSGSPLAPSGKPESPHFRSRGTRVEQDRSHR